VSVKALEEALVRAASERASGFLTLLKRLLPQPVLLLPGGKIAALGGTKFMKRVLIGTFVMGILGIGSAVAQDGWRDRYRDRQDIRRDSRDIARDRRAIEYDRKELRRDLRRGDYAAAARERAEIRARQRDLNRDLWDVRRDRRDLYWDRH
jgi:hypothetical protein